MNTLAKPREKNVETINAPKTRIEKHTYAKYLLIFSQQTIEKFEQYYENPEFIYLCEAIVGFCEGDEVIRSQPQEGSLPHIRAMLEDAAHYMLNNIKDQPSSSETNAPAQVPDIAIEENTRLALQIMRAEFGVVSAEEHSARIRSILAHGTV